jgi:riboflavin biosynthesis pyrimidine reductase
MGGVRPLVPGPDLTDADLLAAYRHDPGLVRANMVTSLDGAVSVAGLSGGLSGAADRRVFRILRTLADVVLAGAGTVRAENYRPRFALRPTEVAVRAAAGLATDVRLAVWSPRLSLEPADTILSGDPATGDRPPLVYCTEVAEDRRLAALADRAELVVLPPGAGPAEALADLAARGLSRVLCEGGPRVLAELIAADALDELCLTVSPVAPGPGPGRVVAGQPWPAPARWVLGHALIAESTLLLRYRRADS